MRPGRRPLSRRAVERLGIGLLLLLGAACFHDLRIIVPSLFADDVHTVSENRTASEPAAAGLDAPPAAEHEGHGNHSGGHTDPVSPVLLAIVIILLVAKIGGDLFERFGMPAVLGELAVGIVLGNVLLVTDWHGLEFLKAPPEGVAGDPYSAGAVIKILAGIGVVLLLFEVGLESSVREMFSVGLSSFLVAMYGVVVPIVLGYVATVLVLGIAWTDWPVPAFIGATLCATSVGITARVLKDLGRSQQTEAKIILGAAVLDDILGLLVLAIISGAIVAAGSSGGGSADSNGLGLKVLKIVVLAVGFLAGALLLGWLHFPRVLFRAANFLRGHGLLVTTALVICFGLAWLASVVGLAPIVGAFAAGLILERAHYRELGEKEEVDLEQAIAPLSALLVPIFFVQMGMQVDLNSFADPSVWLLAGTITVMAIIGKQVCAFGVREKGLNRTAVGLGMIPRGEVGLIFANEGRKLVLDGVPVINDDTYSAVVVMVMITTMVTPPLLKWSLARSDAQK